MLQAYSIGISLFLIAALFGSMLFFAAIVTPAAFSSLEKEHTGRYLQALFPRYYLWGLAIAVLSFAVTASVAWPAAGLLAGVAVGFLFSRQWLLPRINRYRTPARTGDVDAQQRFKQLHGLSVLIHLLQMILLLAAFVLAWR